MNAKTYPMNKKQTGFSLLELMAALAIAMILMSIAVPSFMEMTQNNRLATQTNDFVSSLNLARSEAVKRGNRITVCKSADNATCTAAGGWHQGWIVFVDADNDAAVDAGEELIRAHGSLDGANTLNGITADVTNYISFVSTGFSQLTNGGLQSGQIILCDNRGFAVGRAMILNAAGLIRNTATNDPAVTVAMC